MYIILQLVFKNPLFFANFAPGMFLNPPKDVRLFLNSAHVLTDNYSL